LRRVKPEKVSRGNKPEKVSRGKSDPVYSIFTHSRRRSDVLGDERF